MVWSLLSFFYLCHFYDKLFDVPLMCYRPNSLRHLYIVFELSFVLFFVIITILWSIPDSPVQFDKSCCLIIAQWQCSFDNHLKINCTECVQLGWSLLDPIGFGHVNLAFYDAVFKYICSVSLSSVPIVKSDCPLNLLTVTSPKLCQLSFKYIVSKNEELGWHTKSKDSSGIYSRILTRMDV